jgi:hypothetical protein
MKQEKHENFVSRFPIGAYVADVTEQTGGRVVYCDKYWTIFENGNQTFCSMTMNLCASIPERDPRRFIGLDGGQSNPIISDKHSDEVDGWFLVDTTPSNPPAHYGSSQLYMSQKHDFRSLLGTSHIMPSYEEWMKYCWPEFKKDRIEEAKKNGRPEPVFTETQEQ